MTCLLNEWKFYFKVLEDLELVINTKAKNFAGISRIEVDQALPYSRSKSELVFLKLSQPMVRMNGPIPGIMKRKIRNTASNFS